MCGIAGIVNFQDKTLVREKYLQKVKNMTETLKFRGPDAEGFFCENNIFLGHRRLSIIDPENGKQPMTREFEGFKYTIVYNGELYNTLEIRTEIESHGFVQTMNCDTETLLLGYICFGEKILDKIIGIFAFAIYDEKHKKVFLARDNFGVKPLYYAQVGKSLIFASEQKSILASKMIKAQIDKTGLQEMFSLCPIKTEGITLFKNIFELKGGEMAEFEKNGLRKKIYYKISAKPHTDSKRKTIKKVRKLIVNSIKSQLVSDVGFCTFLSGGLDSSIITAIASKELKKNNKTLSTYSIDFENNDKYFKKSLFQPNADVDFVKIMVKKYRTNHEYFMLGSKKSLCDSLVEAVIARDSPGMADIDSSLLLFCKEIKKNFTVALSGECADEIFCGYPWFWKEDLINKDFFPFIEEKNEKLSILKKEFIDKIKPAEYARRRYIETLRDTPLLNNESNKEKKLKQIQFLSIKSFMQNLLERKDKMSMRASLEVRVPFCDRRIVDYVYNIPFEWKLLNGREKGLMRKAVRGLLPKCIVTRKKSPYPKTQDPEYFNVVVKELKRRLKLEDCKLTEFLDLKKLYKLISSPLDISKPWLGQLMSRPQLIAHLIQIDEWFRQYNVEIVL
ncbi:MAG: asparagine synthase (glutamine-hydrolyzing) [Clostridia bacterium]|nr:asparagine synthase (glutamine-hydrolyzing) [Clostridia bacterium]